MPLVTISKQIDGACVLFTLEGLEATEGNQKPRIYDVFVEFGDGEYVSFYTKNVDRGVATYNYSFSHKYEQPGIYSVTANMKAVYSEDGDPLYPTTTVDVGHAVNPICGGAVPNKLPSPPATGIWLTRSHMPKFAEQNVYVLNYNNLNLDPDYRNFVALFYNQTGKEVEGTPYTQWKTISNITELQTPEVSRVRSSAAPVEVITTELLRNNIEVLNTDELLDGFTDMAIFEITDIMHPGQKNIFVSLEGHPGLQDAVAGEEEQTISLSVAHLVETSAANNPNQIGISILKDAGLNLVDSFSLSKETLGTFHDPNFIKVTPTLIDRGDEALHTWEYNVKFTNDGEDIADYLRVDCYLDMAFFDVDSIHVLDAVFSSKLTTIKRADRVSFEWTDVSLAGANSAAGRLITDEHEGEVTFQISPKNNPPARDKIVAFADIIMGAGDLRETTPTPNVATTHIKEPPVVAVPPVPVPYPNYKPLLWAILIFGILGVLLLLWIIFTCCN